GSVGWAWIVSYTSSIFSFNLTARAASAIISPACGAIINTPTSIAASSNTLTKPRDSPKQLGFALAARGNAPLLLLLSRPTKAISGYVNTHAGTEFIQAFFRIYEEITRYSYRIDDAILRSSSLRI